MNLKAIGIVKRRCDECGLEKECHFFTDNKKYCKVCIKTVRSLSNYNKAMESD